MYSSCSGDTESGVSFDIENIGAGRATGTVNFQVIVTGTTVRSDYVNVLLGKNEIKNIPKGYPAPPPGFGDKITVIISPEFPDSDPSNNTVSFDCPN